MSWNLVSELRQLSRDLIMCNPQSDAIRSKHPAILDAAAREIERLRDRANEGPFFLLYGGTNEDGRGYPKFERITVDKHEAKKHFVRCKNNPYSLGHVDIVTARCIVRACENTDWSKYA